MTTKIRLAANYILWFLGIRKLLPKEFVDRVVVEESREELIQMNEIGRLKVRKNQLDTLKLRKSVAERLTIAADNLPFEYTIILVEGFRSPQRQKELWEKQRLVIEKENPNLPSLEIDRKTRFFVAKPEGEFGGHQTGGAVDVTLGDKNGKELFLGTKVQEFLPETATDSKNISVESRKLRLILLKSMRSAGFVNYPGEWWHFSYGDKLWAAYNRLKKCPYGLAKE